MYGSKRQDEKAEVVRTREVWTEFESKYVDDIGYVPRCSRCGFYPKTLLRHWFFKGYFCHRCVEVDYYSNVWTVKEVNNENEFIRDFRLGEWSV